MTKRLFLFASWDTDSIIDKPVLLYLGALSKLGDIIFYMNNDADQNELAKLKTIPNILYAKALDHGEYDFGCYKRGFNWAKENDLLKNYDLIYMVNDSVYGPFKPIGPILEKLEPTDASMVGMVLNAGRNPEYLQSWFIGFKPNIFNSDWFQSFIDRIHHYDDKTDIIFDYEIGISQEVINKGLKIAAFENKYPQYLLYKKPKRMVKRGLPFIKKSAMEYISIFDLQRFSDEYQLLNIIKHMNRVGISFAPGKKRLFDIRLLSIPIIKMILIPISQNKKIVRDKYILIFLGFIPVFVYKRLRTEKK